MSRLEASRGASATVGWLDLCRCGEEMSRPRPGDQQRRNPGPSLADYALRRRGRKRHARPAQEPPALMTEPSCGMLLGTRGRLPGSFAGMVPAPLRIGKSRALLATCRIGSWAGRAHRWRRRMPRGASTRGRPRQLGRNEGMLRESESCGLRPRLRAGRGTDSDCPSPWPAAWSPPPMGHDRRPLDARLAEAGRHQAAGKAGPGDWTGAEGCWLARGCNAGRGRSTRAGG